MPSSLKILQRYVYDAIDRLSATGLSTLASTQRFYQGDHLVTELGEHSQRTIVRHEAQPLAQHEAGVGPNETTLFATDEAHSLLQTSTQTNSEKFAYTAYGHHPLESGLGRLLGFNGECPDTMTGHYLLGLGKRAFNPVLMRFNSPDELSPFGEGGFNSYAYCENDPTNFFDPTGNAKLNIFHNRSRKSVIVGPKRNSVIMGDSSKRKAAAHTTSAVSSPIAKNSYPMLNALLDRPTGSMPTGPSRTAASVDAPGPPPTGRGPEQNTNSTGLYLSRLKKVEAKYDALLKKTPTFIPTQTKQHTSEFQKLKIESIFANDAIERARIAYLELLLKLRIKKYNLPILTSLNKQIRNPSS